MISPKRRLTSNGLHGVISQKRELFINVLTSTLYGPLRTRPLLPQMLILLSYFLFASSLYIKLILSIFQLFKFGPSHISSTFWVIFKYFLRHPCLIHSSQLPLTLNILLKYALPDQGVYIILSVLG
jgi:hypothetical protein